MYFDASCVHLSGEDVSEIKDNEDEINKALRLFYFNPDILNPDLFEISNAPMQKAVSDSMKESDFRTKLLRNASFFSAYKTVKQCVELTELLYEGERKRGFKEFRKVSKSIIQNYNKNWLKAEVNAVTRSTRMAEIFRNAQNTLKLYPNLEYIASRSANPRDEHKELWGTIRPVNDPFWAKFMPPSAWNCMCSVEPVDSDVTEIPKNLPDVPEVFANNTGKTAELFGKSHPYFDVTEEQKQQINDFLK